MITFLIQGSADEPYEVTVGRDGATLFAVCTCRAGTFGQTCKHVLGVLEGRRDGIVSDNAGDVASVPTLVEGTEAAPVLRDLLDAESKGPEAKKTAAVLKKKLARMLNA